MENGSRYQFGEFLIDVHEGGLWRHGEPVALTPKAFDVLAALVEHPGRLVHKDELLQKVWPDTFVDESNLAYNVFALRKALGDTAGSGRFIETVPKRGYRFTAPVTPVDHGNGQGIAPVMAPAITPAVGAPRDTGTDVVVPAVAPSLWARTRRVVLVALVLAVGFLGAQWWLARRITQPAQALPLTSLTGAVRAPSLSPDGNYVVFAWNGPQQDNPDLYVQQVGAGPPLRLTHDAGSDGSPSWSPDGKTIAFLRRAPDGVGSEVRLIAPLGGPDRLLTAIRPGVPIYRPLSLTWCPDASCVLATDSPGPGQPDALFVIAIDSGRRRQLTFPQGRVADLDPGISPDGRALIFRRDTTPFSGMLFRLPLHSGIVPAGDPVALTPTLSAGKAAWLPNSREVLFGSRGALWRLDAYDGSAPARLPFVGQDGVSPSVSRTSDGRQRLVYVRNFVDGNLWRVDVGPPGTEARPVPAIASTRGDFIPSVSPDGRRIAFLSDRSGDSQIWVSDPDGGHAVQLTTMAFSSSPGFPQWSPDGRTIAFHGDPHGRPDVMIVPAVGGEPRVLTANLPNGGYPRFSRDGRWIYFAVVDGEARVWKMPADGGDAVQVTTSPAVASVESRDGRDLFYVERANATSALWRLPLAGGSPVKVLDGVVLSNFDVVDAGVYYIDRLGAAGGTARLQFFDFATGRPTTIAPDLGSVGFGVSASPDGRTVYYSRTDSSVEELMVVDDFR
jgi:Tol biopolymer transport system component/DNA-binding winged helix-turn-helix (wHTH) protein